MKKLFLIIFVPFAIVVGTPLLLIGIMYDGSGEASMPTHLYSEDADYQKMLYQELDDSLNDVENGITEDLIYNLHEDIINTAIFETITKGDEAVNPDYMPNDNCPEDVEQEKCNYIIYKPFDLNEDSSIQGKLVGVWVEFEDIEQSNERLKQGRLILNVYLEVTYEDGFTYKTVVAASFIITDDGDNESYKFEFEKVKAGNLPLPRSVITGILNLADVDLNSELEGSMEIGVFEQADLSYTVAKQELVDSINSTEGDEEPTPEDLLLQEVLGVILSKYINFDVDDDELSLSIAVSLLKSETVEDIPSYLYDLHDADGLFDPNAFDPEAYLGDSFAEYIFNRALTGDPEFYINESVLNKLIYSGAEGFADMSNVQEYTDADGNIQEIEMGLKALWFEFEEGTDGAEVYAKALFQVAGINSLLEIKTVNVSSDPTELVFDFNRITIGKDVGENDGEYTVFEQMDVFKDVLAGMDSVDFAEFNAEGQLIISVEALSGLLQDDEPSSSTPSFTITEIGVVEGAIYLTVTPEDQALQDILDTLSDNLNSIIEDGTLAEGLEAALDLDDPAQEAIYNEIIEMQTDLTDGDAETNIDPEDIAEMFTNFETLDSDAQAAFLSTFEDAIDPSLFEDFEDIFTNGETED